MDAATLIGKGKAEAAIACASIGASVAIFESPATPAQSRNLEAILSLGVIDRTALILDIFARRARTREANGRLNSPNCNT